VRDNSVTEILDFSPVGDISTKLVGSTSGVIYTFLGSICSSSQHLSFELIEMLLLERVDGLHDVPVDDGLTRRCSHGTLVSPSGSHVNHHHEVSI